MPTQYAHSLPDRPPSDWQPLENHLRSVADLAAEFAAPFGGQDWARIAGLWHDLGKYSNAFQRMLYEANGIESHLESVPGKVVHSQAGGHQAQVSFRKGIDRIFCWLIMGHHAGLADYASDRTGARALEPKMKSPVMPAELRNRIPDWILDQEEPGPPAMLTEEPCADLAFLVRMLFSCLVDADYLDTELFMDGTRSRLRGTADPDMPAILAAFDAHMDSLCSNAQPSLVNDARSRVLAECRAAAQLEHQAFSLTVPTGGGKTLASLAFALEHAVRWQQRRVIYVIPYTSIIEQTAKVFRGIDGLEDVVLEHHSNVSDEDESKESVRQRLAAENWDRPLVVTTSVQFFESLFAAKTSRCRRLHNIANSVVIFDEAQCIPPGRLRPAVFAIRELQRHYGVTPVLCTATQPVLDRVESFDFKFSEGLDHVHEIVGDPAALARELKRVRFQLHDDLRPTTVSELATAIEAEERSVLCVVNSKRDCRELAEMLPGDRTIHLSTNMCAEHRLKILSQVRARLAAEEPLRVISTSLVEAGVDLDFPVVYRALAGLDSIAQAAGRCNREGCLDGHGRSIIFRPASQPGYIRSAASLAESFLKRGNLKDLLDPDVIERYFRLRFYNLGSRALDEDDILGLFSEHLNYYFRSAAQKFQFIDDGWQVPLIVPFGEAQSIVDQLQEWNARRLFRRLQRLTVSIPNHTLAYLLSDGYVHELDGYPGTYVLHDTASYSDRYGFVPPGETEAYPSDSMII